MSEGGARAETGHRPRVVIIGAGFAGLYAARALGRAAVDLTVVDRTNHHVFQPLLYQVATATLAPSDIAAPVRWLLRKQRNTTVLLGEVTAIDVKRRVVSVRGTAEEELAYDYLVVAGGARHAYFGHTEWEQDAPGLKSLDDALEIRSRFLLAFERAEATANALERRALMTFVVVGGGPTGVELAGMLPLIARRALQSEFRRIDTRESRIILLEGGARLLSSFPESLSRAATRDLQGMGVEVRTRTVVTRVTNAGVWIGDEHIAATAFWAAGNEASPLGRMLGAPLDRNGRVLVNPDLSIPSHPEIFVAGDLAHVDEGTRTVPAVAPAAMQGGTTAARNIRRDLEGKARAAFRYRNKGDLATIGRHRAIADFGRLRMSGFLAWWFWLLVHIMYLAGFRNRLSVLIQWAWAYFTYQRGVRLILSGRHARYPDSAGAPGVETGRTDRSGIA